MNTNVMIVDDDPAIRGTVELMITIGGLNGHNVKLAASGEECIQALSRGFRGLILMDVMMPDMTGWQTIAAIRDRGLLDGNVICMLSALVDHADSQHDDVKQHVHDYIIKPFDMDRLLATIDNALRHLAPPASDEASEEDSISASTSAI